MSGISIVLATRNQGKIKEITRLLSGYDMDIKSLNDFGPIPTVEETGKTFDAARTTRWFQAKDVNKDGVIDEQERQTKVPVGWNTKN